MSRAEFSPIIPNSGFYSKLKHEPMLQILYKVVGEALKTRACFNIRYLTHCSTFNALFNA